MENETTLPDPGMVGTASGFRAADPHEMPAPSRCLTAPADPLLGLITLSTEKGVDPTALTKLYDLYERHQSAQAVKEFNTAMNDAQSEMPAVVKNKENKFTKTWYTNLEAVQKVAMPVVTKHGFSLSFGTADSPIPGHIRIVAKVRHKGGHVEEHRVDLPVDGTGAKGGSAAMNPTQGHGSTYSYGQRYLMKMIFNLTLADEDDDANSQGQFITQEQADEIRTLIGAGCEDVARMEGFMKWAKSSCGMETVEQMTAKFYPEAVKQLKRLIEKRKSNGTKSS
jgi:hypothetical protein